MSAVRATNATPRYTAEPNGRRVINPSGSSVIGCERAVEAQMVADAFNERDDALARVKTLETELRHARSNLGAWCSADSPAIARIDAALSTTDAQPQADGWRDIASAPKGIVLVARYEGSMQIPHFMLPARFNGRDWIAYGEGGAILLPTHWRPLLAAPGRAPQPDPRDERIKTLETGFDAAIELACDRSLEANFGRLPTPDLVRIGLWREIVAKGTP